MGSLWQRIFFDNTVLDYVIFLVAIALILIFRRFLARHIASLFFSILHKTSWNVQREVFVNLLKGPIRVFLILLVAFLTLDQLKYPSVLNFTIHRVPFKLIVEGIANAILIIAFIWLLLRLIDFIATMLEKGADASDGHSSHHIVFFFKDFFKVIIIFVGILLVIRFTFNKNIGALLTGFGIVGAALALSARESLENLIASFIIFFDKPFSPGDLVKIQSFTGTVEKIGLRSTRIRTDQKTYVTVPNKQMVDSILDNLTLRTQRRGFLQLEISPATSYESVSQLVIGVENLVSLRKQFIQAFSVVLSDISKDSYMIQVEYFTGAVAMEIFNQVRQDLNLSIIQLMEDMKIKLAGKEREIVVHSN